MRRILSLLVIMVWAAGIIQAQDDTVARGSGNVQTQEDSIAITPTDQTDSTVAPIEEPIPERVFPRKMLGIRGGVNIADMVYSHAPIDRYGHFMQMHPMVGVFGHFQLGKSWFSIRPEVTWIGRGDSLQWLDVNYRMQAQYIDARLPILLNFRFRNSAVSPYLMVAPQFNMAFGGKVSYIADDFPNRVTAPITKADINDYDASMLFGAGIDFLIRNRKHVPIMVLSVEGGYNIGLMNNFAQREIKDNPNVSAYNRSNILNKFLGAELYEETRKSRGIEVAVRLAIPLKAEKLEPIEQDTMPQMPDTVFVIVEDTTPHVPDTVFVTNIDTVKPEYTGGNMTYVEKDCYSFAEMYAFITLGVDISDKRICLFDINFDFNSSRLRPESKKPLNDVAMMMRSYPEMRIRVYGHTDSIGSDNYNDKLSMRRALTVINYLRSQGIDTNRMEAVGYGRKYPLYSNRDEEGRFRNRRVEIDVLNIGTRITTGTKVEEKSNSEAKKEE